MLLDRSKTFQGWDALYFGKKPKLSLGVFFFFFSFCQLCWFYSFFLFIPDLRKTIALQKGKKKPTEESCWSTHTSPPTKPLLWGWQRMLGMQLWQARLVLVRLKWVGGNDEEAPLFLRELTNTLLVFSFSVCLSCSTTCTFFDIRSISIAHIFVQHKGKQVYFSNSNF